MHDHRVTDEREESLSALIVGGVTPATLQRAIADYFNERVRTRNRPDYVFVAANRTNLINSTSAKKRLLHKDLYLVRVVDLSGLSVVFQWARDQGFARFLDFPSKGVASEVLSWLNGALERRRPADTGHFVSDVINVMNAHRTRHPFQPTWTTTWSAFEPFVREGPERWLEVLGMHKPTPGRWLMLLKYRVREAGTIVRPSQLDSGWGAYHFPSPPQVALSSGGHPVDLAHGPAHSDLLPEYIHKQIEHHIHHWIEAGSLCVRTAGGTSANFESQRRKHHRLLVTSYGTNVLRWMPDCL